MKTYPFHVRDIKRDAPDEEGLYAIVYRPSGACVYIGKAEEQTLKARLMQELTNPGDKLGRWIKYFSGGLEFCCRPIAKRGIIDGMETRLIRRWDPNANTYKRKR